MNVAAHQVHQVAGDRRAQPRATVHPADRIVGLGERLEYRRLFFRRDADAGVAHFEADPRARGSGLAQRDPQCHFAALGELHRVRHQVQQHLTQVVRVAHVPVGGFGRDRRVQRESLVAGLRQHDSHRGRQQLAQVEWPMLDVRAAGLDLGQQQMGRGGQRFHDLALRFVHPGFAQQIRHRDHAVERRAHLVAHVREEAAFRDARLLGPVAGDFEPLGQHADIEGQHRHGKQQARADFPVQRPERREPEHDGETDDGERL